MHADGLDFDEDFCDGCGLCVAACPSEALTVDVEIASALPLSDSKVRGRIACNRIQISEDVSTLVTQLPCLYAATPAWIWQYAQKHNITDLEAATGDCAQCDRGPARHEWHRQWQQLARAIPVAGKWPSLNFVSPGVWTKSDTSSPNPSIPTRRAFFRRISMLPSGPSANDAKKSGSTIASARVWLINQLSSQSPPAQDQAHQPLWAVAWNPARCTACLSCTRICPTQALRVESSQEEPAVTSFVVDMSRCIDCGLCIALCQTRALEKCNWTSHPSSNKNLTPHYSPLRQRRCDACGVEFHRLASPTLSSQASGLCHACEAGRPRHHHRLVQSPTHATPQSS